VSAAARRDPGAAAAADPDTAAGPDAAFEFAPSVRVVFTSRTGGVSLPPYDTLNMSGAVGDEPAAVARNRLTVAQACGLADTRLVWMRQVHGARAGYADRGSSGQEVDAIFTDQPGLALGVLAADCACVLLADPAARIIGAAHSGREGTAAGVVTSLVAAMTAAGAGPDRMRALIGPAICGGCYEVSAQVRDRVAAAVPEAACRTRDGTPGLDIRAGITAQLIRAGIRQVDKDLRCTAETAELYSYRRDGRTGRFAGLIWLAA
jgi:purine-nucleoside/S-methyl-5'-thioadenosine phosphorylase / adenosine deaminase